MTAVLFALNWSFNLTQQVKRKGSEYKNAKNAAGEWRWESRGVEACVLSVVMVWTFSNPMWGFAAPYASICFGLHNNEVVPILFLQSAFLELQEKRSLA